MKKINYRGSSAQLETFVGDEGVIVINTDTHRPHVLDGKTPGGHPVALVSDIPEQTDTAALEQKIQTLTNDLDTMKSQIQAVCQEITGG